MLLARIAEVVSPIDAVGSDFIDRTPKWLKDWAIAQFGTNDKLALRAGIWITLAVAALVVGFIARRRPLVGLVGIGLFGVVGAAAAVNRPSESTSAAFPALAGAFVGCALLWYLIGIVRAGDGARQTPMRSRAPRGWDRRRFLVASGSAAAAAAVAGVASERLEQQRLDRLRDAAPDTLPPVAPAEVTLPPVAPDGDAAAAPAPGSIEPGAPGAPAPAVGEVPAGAQLSPTTPFITPNDDFYLIDTALSVPRIDVSRWTVEIKGMVSKPLSLSYTDLLMRPMIERMITIACVSNEVGGSLIGNAVWQGVRLSDLLNEAGVQPGAEQVFMTSVDGWTCGFPVGAALDGRDAMIAIGMNGEPLPLRHGFPARVIVPGLYGYVSATKWLSTIELNRWDDEVGYWVPRGWAREAPVKTQSRIDVPSGFGAITAGPTVIAGIAWAQRNGIAKVEVNVDRTEWREATLGTEATIDTWRHWSLEWDATPGEHVVQVRATDKTGYTQTEEVARPDPDGATGWHTRRFDVK
jgi:DMSO/TMAO reductase YedYZ molybdopterin-dependent catalytic subunit